MLKIRQNIKRIIFLAFAPCLFLLAPHYSMALQTPIAVTGDSYQAAEQSVRLEGYVVVEPAIPARVWFEWGKDVQSISKSPAIEITAPTKVSAYVADLDLGKKYYFRVVSENIHGIAYGEVKDFTIRRYSIYAPRASTQRATGVLYTSARLNGTIDPKKGTDTYWWFEWGLTKELGDTTPRIESKEDGRRSVYYFLTGLKESTTYYYRVVVQNSLGIQKGRVTDFTTGPKQFPGPPGRSAEGILSVETNLAQTGDTYMEFFGYATSSTPLLTEGWFEWGLTPDLGNKTPVKSIGSSPDIVFSQKITGLYGGVAYFYRAVAKNKYETQKGEILVAKTTGEPQYIPRSSFPDSPVNTITQPKQESGLRFAWPWKKLEEEYVKEKPIEIESYYIGEWIFPETIIGWTLLLLAIIVGVYFFYKLLGVRKKQKEEKKRKEEMEKQAKADEREEPGFRLPGQR